MKYEHFAIKKQNWTFFNDCKRSCVKGKREREKKDLGRTWVENSDKLSDKGRARAGLYIRFLVSIKSSPSARRAPNLPGPICTCIPRRYATEHSSSEHRHEASPVCRERERDPASCRPATIRPSVLTSGPGLSHAAPCRRQAHLQRQGLHATVQPRKAGVERGRAASAAPSAHGGAGEALRGVDVEDGSRAGRQTACAANSWQFL